MTSIKTLAIIVYILIEVLTLIKALLTPKTTTKHSAYHGYLNNDKNWAIAAWVYNSLIFTAIYGGVFWW